MNKSSGKNPPIRQWIQPLSRWIVLLAVILVCVSSSALAAISYDASPDGTAPDRLEPPDGINAPNDASFGGSISDLGMTQLTKSDFHADDLPRHYLEPAANPGQVIKIRYTTDNNTTMADLFTAFNNASSGAAADGQIIKQVMVYLPAGYEDSTDCYNILYILHGSSSSHKRYLNPDEPTALQYVLDHMIKDGILEPLIVVAATYYPQDEMVKALPLAMKVQVVRSFPDELVNDIIPQVESQLRTYAASTAPEDIAASREHRAIAGFSLGGVATWYTFQQQMQAFKWFLPISEAGWDDGEDGLTGILDSNVSAQAIYNSVKAQGYGAEDFMLFVATGSDDEAFQVTTNQMISLLAYDDMFIVGTNTSCSMMNNGTHTIDALYTYAYHILPSLFVQ